MSKKGGTTLKRTILLARAKEVFDRGGSIHEIVKALEFNEVYDCLLGLASYKLELGVFYY